jgi:hypothetical protein
MTERYSEQEISRLLDHLIDAWADFEDKNRQWRESRETRGAYPQPPSSFEDVKALADYQQLKAQWEQEEQVIGDPLSAASKRYESLTEQVRALLPRDAPVTHVYSGNVTERAGQYRIVHSLSAYNQISIERVGPTD